MSFIRTIVAGLLASLVTAGTAQAAFIVSYEGEAAGVQNTTATFSFSAVETFDNLPTGVSGSQITQTFSNSATPATSVTLNYVGSGTGGKGVQINSADQYGGSGGTGKYVVAFPSTPYTLNLTSTNLTGGINYFGYWLSALDAGNRVQFYGNNNQLLFTFNPSDVLNVVANKGQSAQYFGNPNSAFKGQDGNEPFIFMNFFDTTGAFSKIVFTEYQGGGGYESDNHTVGNYLTLGQGTVIALVNSVTVPEPATWTMMLVGFGCLGMGMRLRGGRKPAFV
jgi:hypothetical protein